jgi:hypothetical protein
VCGISNSAAGWKWCRKFGLQAKDRSLLSNAVFVFSLPLPVTSHSSRKHFFGKLLGFFAIAGGGARVLAVPERRETGRADVGREGMTPQRGIKVQVEARAVSRRPDTV